MKNLFLMALLSTVIVAINGCSKSMKVVEKTVAFEKIDTLVFENTFDVLFIQGSENKIEIQGAERIVDKISFTENNGEIRILNKYKGNWSHPKRNDIQLRITVKNLSKIVANETCSITCQNQLIADELGLVVRGKLNNANLFIDCNSFYYWNDFPCGGEIILSGKANVLKLWNTALMTITANQLMTQQGFIDNSGKGNCTVRCSDYLDYAIRGEGNIYSVGTPSQLHASLILSSGKLVIL